VLRIDGIFQGNGLGIGHIYGLALDQGGIVFVHNFFGAFFGTLTAGNAFVDVNIARLFDQPHAEVARLARNLPDFCQSQQFDVWMPADLDQFGGQDSHRAVIGGKGFIQLSHHAPDGGGFFNQVYQKPRIGAVKGGLHPGDAAAHNHYGALDIFRIRAPFC
jgi:hypothetical protein